MDKIKEYFKSNAISNSLLGLMNNPRWVKLKRDNPEIEDDDKAYFRIGAALDCLLTSPERWEEDFLVIDANRPYGLLGKFIEKLPSGLTVNSPLELYMEAYRDSGYKMWPDKVVAKFWLNEEAVRYYKLTRDLSDKVTVLSTDEYESVTKALELINANEFVKHYFKSSSIDIEIRNQVPVYFEYMGEPCKALWDGVYIDHKNKTIQIYDLKTAKSVWDFPTSFLQYGYYRQCAFYELSALSKESPIKELLELDYTLLDFIFIAVENKKSSSQPAIIYRTTEKDRLCGLEGGTINGRKYRGINELINAYKFHKEMDYWDMPLELLNSKGEIKLDVFDEPKHESPSMVTGN